MTSDPKPIQSIPVPELPISSKEPPMSDPQFLDFVNANGKTMSREWLYRKIHDGSLPHLRLGKKIMVLPSQILSAMQRKTTK